MLIIEECPVDGKVLTDLAATMGYSIVGINTDESLARIENLDSSKLLWAVQERDFLGAPFGGACRVSPLDFAWLARVEAFVHKHLDDSLLSAENLADAHAISVRHLSRKLKKLTGRNTTQYFREVRLVKAMRLLEEGSCATVKEVGLRVGFSDQKYFSRLFTDRFGKRPSELL